MEDRAQAPARIVIADLPENIEISEDDLKWVQGGFSVKTVVGTVWSAVLNAVEGGSDGSTGGANAVVGVRG